MSESEAIKELSYDNTAYGGKCTEEVRKAAIQALEIVDSFRSLYPLQNFEEEALMEFVKEIQQYRAIGSVEDVQDIFSLCKTLQDVVKKYSAIGTVEECRTAVERMKPKKPYIQQVEVDDCFECPSCDSFIGYVSDCKDEHYQVGFCCNCGQALDWSE